MIVEDSTIILMLILTTWLQTVFYYFDRFLQIGAFILRLNSKETAIIKECQTKLQDTLVSADLQTIRNNFK